MLALASIVKKGTTYVILLLILLLSLYPHLALALPTPWSLEGPLINNP